MTVFQLPSTGGGGIGGSNWKPKGAGDPTIQVDFIEPLSILEQNVVALEGVVSVKLRLRAGWTNRQGSGFLTQGGGFIGIPPERVRLRLTRGAQVFNGAGWMTLPAAMAANYWLTVMDYGTVSVVRDESQEPWFEAEVRFPADRFGTGRVDLQIYAEGIPRYTERQARRHGNWNPRVAVIESRALLVDGDPPETSIDPVVSSGDSQVLSGTVTDALSGPLEVELVIRDKHTNLYWNETNRNWDPFSHIIIPTGPTGHWRYDFTEGHSKGSGRYEVSARGRDRAVGRRGRHPNLDPSAALLVPDLVTSPDSPVVTIASPENDAKVGNPLVASGTVQDDGAIEQVRIALRDRYTGLWWDGYVGAWSPVQVDNAISSWSETGHSAGRWHYDWSLRMDEPADGSGKYRLVVSAQDAAGHRHSASVQLYGANDRIPPVATIIFPAPDQKIQGYPGLENIQLSASGNDEQSDSGTIQFSVQDTETDLFWNFETYAWVRGQVVAPALVFQGNMGGEWVWSDPRFNPDTYGQPGSGSYRLMARAIDAAGNKSPEVYVKFYIDHFEK